MKKDTVFLAAKKEDIFGASPSEVSKVVSGSLTKSSIVTQKFLRLYGKVDDLSDEQMSKTFTHLLRRCPFLLNILEACGAIKIGRSEVSIVKMLLNDVLVMPHDKEEASIAKTRLDNLRKAWPSNVSTMPGEDISILKELFGSSFLTEDFYIKQLETVEV